MAFQLGRKSKSAFGSFTSHYGNMSPFYFEISSSVLHIFLLCVLDKVIEEAKKSGAICDLRAKKKKVKYPRIDNVNVFLKHLLILYNFIYMKFAE